MQTAIKSSSREEYLTFEETAQMKHEFYQGEIFAMVGGTFNHGTIGLNVTTTLKIKLRGKPCQPTNSDVCIETPGGLLTYPDAAVFCGKAKLTDRQRTLLNPVVIIEVLSPSTRRYDKSDKFMLYRAIPTFQDYLLIDSETIYVEHFRKTAPNEWILHEYRLLAETILLNSIQETLALAEIYEGISFET